jgi:hypothetical protein
MWGGVCRWAVGQFLACMFRHDNSVQHVWISTAELELAWVLRVFLVVPSQEERLTALGSLLQASCDAVAVRGVVWCL